MSSESKLRVVGAGSTPRLEPDPSITDREQFRPYLFELEQRLKQAAIPRKLAVSSMAETEYVAPDNIIRLEASGCYTLISLEDGRKLTTSRALGEYEEILDKRDFIRVHYSHLVNLMHVRKYVKKDGLSLEMADSSLVPVAVRRKEAFEHNMQLRLL